MIRACLTVLMIFSLGAFGQTKTGVKDPCAPMLLLNGYKSGDTVTKTNLLTLNALTIYFPCTKKISYRVIQYELTIGKSGSVETIHSFTHVLTARILSAFKKADVGDRIIIDMVVIRKPDLTIQHVPGMIIYVGSSKGSAPIKIDTAGLASIPTCHPVFYVGQFKDGATITKNQLNLISQVSAGNSCNTGKKQNGCSTDIIYKVMSYKLSANINETPWSLEAVSSEFPLQVRDQFRNVKSPTQLVISDIKAKYSDGCIVEIPDVVLNITPALPEGKQGVNNFVRNPRKK